MTRPLTPAMRRELAAISRTGEPSDLYDWHAVPGALAFYARDKVLGALIARGLVESTTHGWTLTAAGRAATTSTT